MNTTFDFANRLGYNSPFADEGNEQKSIESISYKKGGVKVRKLIRFLGEEGYEKKYQDVILDSSEDKNRFVVFAKLSPEGYQNFRKNDGQGFYNLVESGIASDDITLIHGVGLGRELAQYILNNPSEAGVIVDDFLNWISVLGTRREELKKELVRYTKEYIEAYVEYLAHKAPDGFEELMTIFNTCIVMGVEQLTGLAKDIFDTLADKIRLLKLGDQYWNPNVISDYKKAKEQAEKNNEVFDQKEPEGYTPLFVSPSAIVESINLKLDYFNFSGTKIQDKEEGWELEGNIFDWLNVIIENCKRLFKKAFDFVDETIKCANAVVVGIYNGVVELIASIFEGIGDLIQLLNFDNIKTMFNGLKDIFSNGFWNGLFQLIKSSIKSLFNFTDDDHIYKNSYEFGLFIPKIIDIILDVISGVKGAAKAIRHFRKLTDQAIKKAKNIQIKVAQVVQSIFEFSEPLLEKFKELNVKFYVYVKDGSGLIVDDLKKRINGNYLDTQQKYYKVVVDGDEIADVPEEEFYDAFNDLNNKSDITDEDVNKRLNELEESKNNVSEDIDDTWKYIDSEGASGHDYENLKEMEVKYQEGGDDFEFEKKVKYLDDNELIDYEVFVKYDRLVDKDGNLLDTSNSSSVDRSGEKVICDEAIYAMSDKGNLYIHKHSEFGYFHHSSFLNGEKVAAAGELKIENGVMIHVTNISGHYMPNLYMVEKNILLELERRGYFTSGKHLKEDIKFKGFSEYGS